MAETPPDEGAQMYAFIVRLFDICRSITGHGVRQTHQIIRDYLPQLETHEVASGTRCCDWVVPDEWNIEDAYIADQQGNKIVDFKENNLHVVGYSEPVNKEVTLEELQQHLFSLPEQPDAIPYVTSYYRRTWGFCITDEQRKTLADPSYRVVINSDLSPGSLTYSDLYIPGQSQEEVYISTYTCHPSLANNELSGPAVATFLADWLTTRENYYSYRIVFAPETIGPLVYLSEHLDYLKKHVIAAFNLTCCGDDRAVSFLPSRTGNTLTDRVARHVLQYQAPGYQSYDFIQQRGSDERQYCSPGVDFPMVSIMRSRYGNGDFPEYHTSADDLTVVSPKGLQKTLDLHKACIQLIETNRTYQTQIIGEPQFSRRGIIVQFGGGTDILEQRKKIQNFLVCCNGNHDLLSIAETIGVYGNALHEIVELLIEHEIIKQVVPQTVV